MPFPTTHLSLVRRVGSDDAETRSRAQEILAAVYWRPIYAHIRLAHRQEPADAEDLTQGFFAEALRRKLFARYEPSRARFRTFVRTCVDSYVANAFQAERRHKRGGAHTFVSIDCGEVDARLRNGADADEVFQQEWTRSVFAAAVDRLREKYQAAGRQVHLAVFEEYDLAPSDADRPTYAQLAAKHAIPATQVTNWLASTRRDLRRIVVETLRELTASDEEFRDEARALFGREIQ